jgi:signal transduction histidine kinase
MNNISRLIDMQRELILTTLLTTLLGATLTFILSRNFVKSSLKDINKLVHYVKTIDIHNLHTPVPLSGPEDDEIRIIGQTLQHSLDTIKTQTDSLKDFVSYASHELKTPMSTINSIIDLADKTGKYSEITPKVKKTLSEMSNLLDTLLLITKREFQSIKKEDRDIVSLIEESAKEF